MPRALLPPPPPQNASRFTIYYSSSLSFCIGVFFCYAQRQPDDILLPFVRKVYEEGYKEETSTLGCLPYKSNNWGKTVESIFGRKKQKRRTFGHIFRHTRVSRETFFCVCVTVQVSPVSILSLPWLRETYTQKSQMLYYTVRDGMGFLGFLRYSGRSLPSGCHLMEAVTVAVFAAASIRLSFFFLISPSHIFFVNMVYSIHSIQSSRWLYRVFHFF